jgi:N12 class adenine-specific DNA methylase
LVGQWANDTLTRYPGANVLAASRKDFVKDRRKLMLSKIATGDWDIVIGAHSSFGRIPVPIETENAILDEQMREIIDAIKETKQDKGAKFTVKDLERTKVRVEERMSKLADRPQDD